MRKRVIPNVDPIDVPSGCAVDSRGYVYMNADNTTARSRSDNHVYSTHKKIPIGRIIDPSNRADRRFYPNRTYLAILNSDSLPEPPAQSDSLSVGFYAAIQYLAVKSELAGMLGEVFGSENARLVLDLASFMISEESAVFQHYPKWAREHVIFSGSVRSDSFISEFINEDLSISKINQFKEMWAKAKIGTGDVYFCYDSTNVNSQAEGVALVERGHAKDDPDLMQVNTDYVVRQGDGLPLTFMQFPGSIVDISQASEMIAFIKGIDEKNEHGITAVCDRGYISEENIRDFDDKHVNFLLLMKSSFSIHEDLLDKYAKKTKGISNYMEDTDEYGITVVRKLFGINRYFHLIWNSTLEFKHRKGLTGKITRLKKELESSVNRKKRYTDDEIRKYDLFDLTLKESGTLKVKARGRGKKNQTAEVKAYVITGYELNEKRADRELSHCGYYILMTSKEMTAEESRTAYAKRDIVEKTFQSLKSHMGMEKYGVTTEERMHGKALIWFVASILHSLLFSKTEKLRAVNKKDFTTPAMIDSLEAIKADRNITTGKYSRRYKLTKQQKAILKELGISERAIDETISGLTML